MRIFKPIGRAVAGTWRLLDAARRLLLNLLLLALIVAVAWLLLRGGPAALQPKTALVLNIRGPIHEQTSGDLRENTLGRLQGKRLAETRLRDVLAALDTAAKDPAIARAVLVLDDFGGAGLPTLREVAAALERFKSAGKTVTAWGSGYDQRGYYLAAHANEVWMHPMGAVQIQGYGGYRNYYKDALDKLGVTVHVLRTGQFKSFGETYVRNAPSAQSLEEDAALYADLWQRYGDGVERARKLAAGSVQRLADTLPERAAAAAGDLARMAVADKLVDALKTRDEMRAALIERGAKDGETFRQIDLDGYLAHVKPRGGADAVAVVVAEGGIVEGRAAGGGIGGESTSALIRRAREDKSVKALVLRVDSPGGSAFGSELIRRELELTRAAGKPVVVSMGDVAASGGYWISTASDETIADEATVTGSIGVVAVFPTVEQGLDKVGVHTGGTATSWQVGAADPRRGLDPRMEQVLQSSIGHTYREFTARVAAARRQPVERIDAVAQGRVWSGRQALERGLVDRTGGFGDALAAAAKRGGLPAEHRIVYVEEEPGRTERLLALLTARVRIDVGLPALPAWTELRSGLAWLAAAAAGRNATAPLAHCLCEAP